MDDLQPNGTQNSSGLNDDLAVDNDQSLDCSIDQVQYISFYLLIPATIIIIILMCLEVRKNLFPNYFGGRFACVIPLNLIENKNNRLPYIAAFVLISLPTANVFLKDSSELMGVQARNDFESVVLKQIYIAIICIIFFPIFACCSVTNVVGLLLGTGYAIGFMVYRIYGVLHKLVKNSCDLTTLESDSLIALILFLVIMHSSGICFIVCQFMKIKLHVTNCKLEIDNQQFEAKEYDKLYTKNLFQTEKSKTPIYYKGKKRFLKKVIHKLHANIPGFRYSLSILSSISVALIIIFFFASLLMVKLFSFWMILRDFVIAVFEQFEDGTSATVTTAVNFVMKIANTLFLGGLGKIDDARTISYKAFILAQINTIFWSAILAILAALICTCFLSIHMLKSYRKDMKNLYKSKMISEELISKNPASLVVRANSYAGYQVAYFVWGFVLQSIVLWIFLMILGEVIVFPLVYGMWGYLLGFFYKFGPLIIMIYLTWAVQYLLVKFFFVQGRGKYLALDNRRGFMNLMYFFFFYNMFIGLFSCFKRILKSMVFGLFFIPRLDKSILPKSFEEFDAGFKAYVCLLKLESLQTNPILITFLSELYNDAKKKIRIDSSSGLMVNEDMLEAIQGKRRKIARTRWFLARTLIFNPCLQVERWSRERLQTRLDVIVVPKNNELRLEED